MITPGGRVGDSSPLGKGPRKLDDYVRAVSHALMRKGVPESHAIAIAKNSLKRWRRGGGHVRPQVRAGAAAHLATQEAIDKHRGGGGVNLAVPIGASAQDGPRATMHAMATAPAFGGKKAPPFTKGGGKGKKGKMRPGSIPSGKGKGKFPITSQQSVKSAASLLSQAKGVSKAAIVAHVQAEAKKRGLKLTPVFKPKSPGKKATNLTMRDGAMVQVVDLVGPKGFSHGWVRASGPTHVAPRGSKSRVNPPSAPAMTRTKGATPKVTPKAPKMGGNPTHPPIKGGELEQRVTGGSPSPAAAKAVRLISTSIASNQLRKLGLNARKSSPALHTHTGQVVQSMSNPKGFKVQKSLGPDGAVHVDLHHGYDTGKPKGDATNAKVVAHFESLGYHVQTRSHGRYTIHNKKP